MKVKTAVVLLNLGGPDRAEAVAPYLRNLFSDPAIIRLPAILRLPIARLIADRRAPYARDEIFGKLGGASPLLAQTMAQSEALSQALADRQTAIFIAMRYWHPRAKAVCKEVVAASPERVVLLPLYPQFSTATTASSIAEFERELSAAGFGGRIDRICCYPIAGGWIDALARNIAPLLTAARAQGAPRLLFSAHGLPLSVVRSGDPYVWQVQQTALATVLALGRDAVDWSICYQSRVGPLKWTGPSIDEEIARAAANKRAIVIAPIAFVSEHSETLVELDIKYRDIAIASGVPAYYRASTVGIAAPFIETLARLVHQATNSAPQAYCNRRICPRDFSACPNRA